MKRIIQHFYDMIGRMAPSQILFFSIAIVAMIIGTFLIFSFAQNQYYAPLYSNLSGEEAGQIINRLEGMGISYEISDNGLSINIPSGDVHRTRMKLATEGLPNPSNIGYAIFDESSLGMTDFLQKVNFKRAIEGELARTISGFNEVSSARVHLVIPEERLFEEDQNSPSASIVIKLNGATNLTRSQLRGVTYLVASSVEGMTPENVTVLDFHGNLLTSKSSSDPTAMLSSNQFELRQNVERYLESKAQSLLERVVGSGKATVKISAELNFEQQTSQIEQYDPDGIAIRSEQKTIEAGDERETLPGAVTNQGTTTSTTQNQESTITNYEVSRTVQSIIGEVGTIKKLTVAVIVDGTYKKNETPEGIEEPEYIPRTQDELNNFGNVVKNAVGYTEARGDAFEIVNVPYDNSLLDMSRELDKIGNWSTYIYYGKKIGTFLLLLLAFLYLKKKAKKIFAAVAKYVPPPPPPPSSMEATPMAEQEIIQQAQQPRLIDTMKTQTDGKPDEIAKVIKTMMTE